MKLVKTHFFSLLMLLAVSGGYTIGFFSDIEGPAGNMFVATVLDQDVAGEPIDGLLCNQVERVGTTLYTGNLGALSFHYGFRVENASGTLCGDLSGELTGAPLLFMTGHCWTWKLLT